MGVTHVVATPVVADAAAAHGGSRLGVALYHAGTRELPGLGRRLPEVALRSLPSAPSVAAWDFLSIAIAAFAADRFILRSAGEDGWTRAIALDVAVADPGPWVAKASRLAGALRFLTGDIWYLTFRAGGAAPPAIASLQHDRDAISLFSGGLDSLLGALRLLADGRRPFLVSQGSTKEVGPQMSLARQIGLENDRFDGRIRELWRAPYEPSTRGRSLIFFAYGAVAASAHGLDRVIVPENGLIAINPPFTRRRIGSLSTRTTHPFFLAELEAVLASAGVDVRLTNIFEHKTKGEMLAECAQPGLQALAAQSYSCGKGKRLNGQCGRCVPCLIRRAAFHHAGLPDGSTYKADLSRSARNDDVLAARLATARVRVSAPTEIARWATLSGPLPADPARRQGITGAVARGLAEMASFLDGVTWR